MVLQQELALRLLSVFKGKNPQTMALAVNADGLKHGELAYHTPSIGGSEQDVTAAVELVEGLGLAGRELGDATGAEHGDKPRWKAIRQGMYQMR
jgi:hypothetical protein